MSAAAGAAQAACNMSTAISARSAPKPSFRPTSPISSAYSRCRKCAAASFELEGAARYDKVNVESQVLGVERDFNSYSFALGAGLYPDRPAAHRREPQPCTARACRRRAVLQRTAYRNAGVRGRQPRFHHRKELGWRSLYPLVDAGRAACRSPASTTASTTSSSMCQPGLEEDDLPVFQFIQNDAKYYGLEAEASVMLRALLAVSRSAPMAWPIMSTPRSTVWAPSRAFRRCVCWAAWRRRATRSTCAPRSNGSTTSSATPISRPKPKASRWSTPAHRGSRSARRAA